MRTSEQELVSKPIKPVIEILESRALLSAVAIAASNNLLGEYHGVVTINSSTPRLVMNLQSGGSTDGVTGQLNAGALGTFQATGTLVSGKLNLTLTNGHTAELLTATLRGTSQFKGTFSDTIAGQTVAGSARLNFVKVNTVAPTAITGVVSPGSDVGMISTGIGFGNVGITTTPIGAATFGTPTFGTGATGTTTSITTGVIDTCITTGIDETGIGIGEAGVGIGATGDLTGGATDSGIGSIGTGVGGAGIAIGDSGVGMGSAGVGMGSAGIGFPDTGSGGFGIGNDSLIP